MATISSPGIASGLDIQSIVTQLVALERAPLTQLRSKATSFQTKLSTMGTIKSQVSALGDADAQERALHLRASTRQVGRLIEAGLDGALGVVARFLGRLEIDL
jgi:flagellar capping protein FliD